MENNIELKNLTKEEFDKNSVFYQKCTDDISLSVGIKIHCLVDWYLYFRKCPINSVVYLTYNSVIVSFMYATPYMDTNLKHWGISYLQTHKDCQRKGFGKKVLLYGLKDMLLKGADKVDIKPNKMSRSIMDNIVDEYGLIIREDEDSKGLFVLSDIEKIKDVDIKRLIR